MSKWFLFWQRSPQWALYTTSKPFVSTGFPMASLSQLQLCSACVLPATEDNQQYHSACDIKDTGVSRNHSLVSHILAPMLIWINSLTQRISSTWDHGVCPFLLVLWISTAKQCKHLKIIVTIISYSPEHGLVSCGEALVPFCGSLVFVTDLPQSSFDQDVLLSVDAFSTQQVWVFTGRDLPKLSIALMAGISSGSTQSTTWDLWHTSLKVKNLSSWTNTSRGVHLSMTRLAPAIWSAHLKQLFAITPAVHSKLAASEWSATTFQWQWQQCITPTSHHLIMFLGTALNSQFCNTLNILQHLLIERYEVSKCTHLTLRWKPGIDQN